MSKKEIAVIILLFSALIVGAIGISQTISTSLIAPARDSTQELLNLEAESRIRRERALKKAHEEIAERAREAERIRKDKIKSREQGGW